MNSWAMYDGHGNQITRGWQTTEERARARAQELADERGDVVELVEEPCGDGARTIVVRPGSDG